MMIPGIIKNGWKSFRIIESDDNHIVFNNGKYEIEIFKEEDDEDFVVIHRYPNYPYRPSAGSCHFTEDSAFVEAFVLMELLDKYNHRYIDSNKTNRTVVQFIQKGILTYSSRLTFK